jgi:alanyl-tRNA synthetase
MQYLRGAGEGKEDYPILGDLPQKNIDTGLGLERLAFLLQGVDNLYEIDEVYPVIARVEELSGRRYGASEPDDIRMRVIADHVRSGLMLMGDGVTPSNEARGYVLRRVLRRVVRSMRLLGVQDPTLVDLLTVSKERMAASYPELEDSFARISQLGSAEEDAFARTLAAGTTILDLAVKQTRDSGADTLPGDKAFQLHDTYGFPIDLTLEMAGEQGLRVDEGEFRRLMAQQRDRAKADAREKKTGGREVGGYRGIADSLGRPVEFTGYEEVVSDGPRGGPARRRRAGAGREQRAGRRDRARPHAVLRRGRRPARGRGPDRARRRRRRGRGRAVADHRARRAPRPGALRRGALGAPGAGPRRHRAAQVDQPLAHRDAHGAQGDPRGDGRDRDPGRLENSPGRFRFDFHASAAAAGLALRDVEARVNALLAEDLEVHAEIMTQEQARAAARWPCSARSTATRCASSASATGRGSCAAARTRSAPARSAWCSCSARARSAPASAGSRRSSARTRTSSRPASTCSCRSSRTR